MTAAGLRCRMLFFLLFAWLSASPCVARGISSNDPFRAIALAVTKPESPPKCCLKASTPLEPLDDEVLLSFEDWKKKQQVAQQAVSAKETVGDNQNLTVADENASNAGTHNLAATPDSNISTGYVSGSLQPPDISPHFRVPITDRFNYANMDCSARVHTSHRSAKSASSILSSKKDRYMLSPCNSGREKQFVVVELCDDIRIDTVQMANFEFFSGVFKDFAVSVAKTYSIDPDGWILAGTYRAKHVRGVQSFHPPTSLRDFYRFIRIDFLSHYGNEYYCPISLLRVYGLTQLEEWKWDIWQAESRAKLEKGPVVAISPPLDDVAAGKSDGRAVVEPTTTAAVVLQETSTTAAATLSTATPFAAITQNSLQGENDGHRTSESSPIPSGSSQSSISGDASQLLSSLQSSTLTQDTPSPALMSPTSVPETPQNPHESIASSFADTHQVQTSNHSTIDTPSSTTIPGHSSIPPAHPSPSNAQAQSSPPPPTGESVYRTIMNRLTAIENNQTLYMKYVEQQNGAIRDVIRRLGEDVGRLEGLTRAQESTLQKAVNDWEKQRYQLQMEYKDILRRMEILSQDIILEKRLGVVQLCLLLAVLIFLGLTRGSRANERFSMGKPSSENIKTGGVRAWGRRHLSWTGDRSEVARKLAATADREGWKKGNDDRNRSPDRMREELDTKTSIKRPKPLVLSPSNADNILRDYSASENLKLPFPSSQPPLGSTLNRPRTRTRSHSRSRVGSGTATPLCSVPIPGNGHGISRRMAFQRPVTPTSRAHFVFRTPQAIQRSHSFNRSATPLGTVEAPVNEPSPLPMSQTSSWGGEVGVVPKSAKNWARTAHLHDVKSAKKRHEQERLELARSKGKNKRETIATDVEHADVFLGSLKKQQSNVALDDAPEALSSQRNLLPELIQHVELHKIRPMILTVEDDLWVDTDSASVDDGIAETF